MKRIGMMIATIFLLSNLLCACGQTGKLYLPNHEKSAETTT